MTKKDYVEFVVLLAKLKQFVTLMYPDNVGANHAYSKVVEEVTDLLARDNPRFNYDKFIEALNEATSED